MIISVKGRKDWLYSDICQTFATSVAKKKGLKALEGLNKSTKTRHADQFYLNVIWNGRQRVKTLNGKKSLCIHICYFSWTSFPTWRDVNGVSERFNKFVKNITGEWLTRDCQYKLIPVGKYVVWVGLERVECGPNGFFASGVNSNIVLL